eukprot:SAG31_NODE_20386_length_576_cov_0.867925_1_plen_168_part_10
MYAIPNHATPYYILGCLALTSQPADAGHRHASPTKHLGGWAHGRTARVQRSVQQRDRPSCVAGNDLGRRSMGDTRVAYAQVWLLAGARVALQTSRICFGTLLVFMESEFQISTVQKGRLLAAFPAGYMMSQVAGGVAADRFGGKPVMTAALLCTAICTAMLILAGSLG